MALPDGDLDPRLVRLSFVCLGNICRSPTAEGIMTRLVADAGLADRVLIDSAGTGAWHIGEPADRRSADEARRHGIELTSRARQFHPGDFYEFDLILAMDRRNLADLHDAAPEGGLRDKAVLLRTFDPAGDGLPLHHLDVPDPYHGGPRGFADVFDLVEAACAGLLDHVRDRLSLEPDRSPPAAPGPASR